MNSVTTLDLPALHEAERSGVEVGPVLASRAQFLFANFFVDMLVICELLKKKKVKEERRRRSSPRWC